MANPTIKDRPSPLQPPGERTSLWRSTLAKGADVLQDRAPLGGFDVYVVGFHCAKNDPAMQMEAHHYCRQVNHDFIQCMIFDGNTRDANLIGIEYIVSERLFATLPDDEQARWHPHNYEVLSGELVAPGLPDVVETAFMRTLMNSYGKTWHTWHSGRHDRGGGTPLPVGEAMLMWSFNRDGEVEQSLKHHRDEHLKLDVAAKRAKRQELAADAHPQRGVNALRDAFPIAEPIPGVVDAEER